MPAALAMLAAMAALAWTAVATRPSSAAFTTTSQSRLEASADRASRWLNLYAQGTDPWGDTGYATQVGSPDPAASGRDETTDVRFRIPDGGTWTHTRVLKVRTPASFPDPAVTSVTVTATIVPDAATGRQPIRRFGVDVWGAIPTYTTTVANWAPGVQRQLNLETRFPGNSIPPGDYAPQVILTVTFTGFTATFYQYTIPIHIRFR